MRLFALMLLCLPTTLFASETKKRIQDLVRERTPLLESIYHQLHKNPELSGKEKNTAALLAKEWRKQGLEVTENVGGTGVVAVLKNGKGPVGLLRTELDALPIQEETHLPYQSKIPGVMHACGHDVHMANLLGVSYVLGQLRDTWHGTVVFIAQPAEETSHGARDMIAAGLFERFPKPQYACFTLQHQED